MPSSKPSLLAIVATSCLGSQSSLADTTPITFQDFISKGKASLNLRYRFEHVDQDGIAKEAKASTLRTRLTLASADLNGFSILTEFDDVTAIGDDDYNSTANGNTSYTVVADPTGTELNQAYVQYAGEDAKARLGRQRILHGSQRFIGGVGWRQNEQTYDGLRVVYKPAGSGLDIDYSYVQKVNRIFGPPDGPVQPGDLEGDNHFFTASYALNPQHKLGAFAYLLDIDEDAKYPAGRSVGNSTNTYGVSYTGKFDPFSLTLSYASQSEAGDSPLDYSADYFLVEGGTKIQKTGLKLGYEVLGSDNGVGFKTPFATLHKFQGWSDKFLVTPGDGIQDLYASVVHPIGPVKLLVAYHHFEADDSSTTFGKELDIAATWKATKNLGLQLKYANFMSDDEDRYTDTEKLWLTATLKL